MAHWCRICGYSKPNEQFTGKGHRNHICKHCSKKPKTEIQKIEQTEEIFRFLKQSNISAKNIARLTQLAASSDFEVAHLASIVLEVAKIMPGKKRRLKVLAREQRGDLLDQMRETGLIYAHHH